MEEHAPNNKEGYNMGFHRPPRNTQYHLHLHLIVLPLKEKRWEKSHGTNITKPKEVLDFMEGLLKKSYELKTEKIGAKSLG